MTKAQIKIQTKAYGEIEIEKTQCLKFADGLFGFRDRTDFALLDMGKSSYFKWLQDLNDPALAFTVIQPEMIFPDYKPIVNEEDLAAIDLTEDDDIITFVLVTIPEQNPQDMTANLQGPIIINKINKKARQIISNSEFHLVRVKIIDNADLSQINSNLEKLKENK
jgi:flagellar assembly factor FliW